MVETYTEYRMEFIWTSPGLRPLDRKAADWDFGLANFGYEAVEHIDPFRFAARSLDEAREIAARHWQAWLAEGQTDVVEGYRIVTSDDEISHLHVQEDYSA